MLALSYNFNLIQIVQHQLISSYSLDGDFMQVNSAADVLGYIKNTVIPAQQNYEPVVAEEPEHVGLGRAFFPESTAVLLCFHLLY